MEKRLTSIRPFTEHRGKTKSCAHCGNIATQEALFEVDEGVTLIEKAEIFCNVECDNMNSGDWKETKEIISACLAVNRICIKVLMNTTIVLSIN